MAVLFPENEGGVESQDGSEGRGHNTNGWDCGETEALCTHVQRETKTTYEALKCANGLWGATGATSRGCRRFRRGEVRSGRWQDPVSATPTLSKHPRRWAGRGGRGQDKGERGEEEGRVRKETNSEKSEKAKTRVVRPMLGGWHEAVRHLAKASVGAVQSTL